MDWTNPLALSLGDGEWEWLLPSRGWSLLPGNGDAVEPLPRSWKNQGSRREPRQLLRDLLWAAHCDVHQYNVRSRVCHVLLSVYMARGYHLHKEHRYLKYTLPAIITLTSGPPNAAIWEICDTYRKAVLFSNKSDYCVDLIQINVKLRGDVDYNDPVCPSPSPLSLQSDHQVSVIAFSLQTILHWPFYLF